MTLTWSRREDVVRKLQPMSLAFTLILYQSSHARSACCCSTRLASCLKISPSLPYSPFGVHCTISDTSSYTHLHVYVPLYPYRLALNDLCFENPLEEEPSSGITTRLPPRRDCQRHVTLGKPARCSLGAEARAEDTCLVLGRQVVSVEEAAEQGGGGTRASDGQLEDARYGRLSRCHGIGRREAEALARACSQFAK